MGLVGVTTPRLGSITSTGNIGIIPSSGEMRALAENIQCSVDALTGRGIDKVILLSHMPQISVKRELAGMHADVDVIVAGGSNTLLADDNDRLWPGDEPADPDVEEIVGAVRQVLRRREGNALGKTEVYLDGRRSEVRTEEANLGNLTADATLWYAKQYDSATAVSIKNGGGIRASIGSSYVPAGSVDYEPDLIPPPAIDSVGKPEGGISQFDIEGSLRFNNGLTLLTVTAAELYDIVEHAVAGTSEGATPGQFPQVGGMRFSFDPSRTARSVNQQNMGAETDGSRIRDLVIVNDARSVRDRVVIDGELRGDRKRAGRPGGIPPGAVCR